MCLVLSKHLDPPQRSSKTEPMETCVSSTAPLGEEPAAHLCEKFPNSHLQSRWLQGSSGHPPPPLQRPTSRQIFPALALLNLETARGQNCCICSSSTVCLGGLTGGYLKMSVFLAGLCVPTDCQDSDFKTIGHFQIFKSDTGAPYLDYL